jgi:hypothetical protein
MALIPVLLLTLQRLRILARAAHKEWNRSIEQRDWGAWKQNGSGPEANAPIGGRQRRRGTVQRTVAHVGQSKREAPALTGCVVGKLELIGLGAAGVVDRPEAHGRVIAAASQP